MAAKTKMQENPMLKVIMLSVALVAFLGWRFLSGGFSVPKLSSTAPSASSAVQGSAIPAAVSSPVPVTSTAPVSNQEPAKQDIYKAVQTNQFIDQLLKQYRPRLSLTASSPALGLVGNVDFYDEFQIVESYSIKELHALGVALVRRPYGIDLIYDGKSFVVSSWLLPKTEVAQDEPAVQDAVDKVTDKAESSEQS